MMKLVCKIALPVNFVGDLMLQYVKICKAGNLKQMRLKSDCDSTKISSFLCSLDLGRVFKMAFNR